MATLAIACFSVAWMPSSGFTPKYLEHFDSTTLPDGLRRYSHRHEHHLSDGKLLLDWTIHADPKTILSLDAHRGRCARLAECSEGRLSLHLKASCVADLEGWRYIVASDGLHRCRHLDDRNLYARVLNVRSRSQGTAHTQVLVDIEELESHAHVVPFMNFRYYYMPHEAIDSSHMAQKKQMRSQGRQLGVLSEFHTEAVTLEHSNSALKFIPNQMKNFGWNWDFGAKRAKRTEFNYSLPGGEGYVKLWKPFVKAHAGVEINFTSHFSDSLRAPHVQLRVTLDGHAHLSGKMSSLLRLGNDAEFDPLQNMSFPILHELQEPIWLGKVSFSVGGIPVTFNPGVRLRATAYHIGKFKGTLQMGLEMHAKIRPELRFDSAIGLDVDLHTKITDVKLSPPNWNIWTRHFEMGTVLEPQLFLQGDMGLLRNASMGLSLKPYMNLTISREKKSGQGIIPAVERKPLVVYPLSATGLPKGRKYAIKVGAGGIFRKSSTQLILDDYRTLYNDSPEKFRFEPLSEESLMGNPLTVALLEEGKEPPVSITEVLCETMKQGECLSANGAPLEAKLMSPGGRDISVELVVLWSEDPTPVLKERMHGLELGLPWLVLTESMKRVFDWAVNSLSLRLLQDGQTFSLPLTLTNRGTQIVLESNRLEHLSPVLWPSGLSNSKYLSTLLPKIQLMDNGKVIGEGDLTAFYYDETHTAADDVYQEVSGKDTSLAPVELVLYNPSDKTKAIAAGHISVAARSVATASFWIYPYQAVKMKLDTPRTLYWTAEVPADEIVAFHIDAFKMVYYLSEPNLGLISTVHKTVVQRCSFRVPVVRKFGNYENPCVFSTEMMLTSANVSVGDEIAFRVSWKWKNREHEMLSVPVRVASSPDLPELELVKPQNGTIIRKGDEVSISNLNIAWSHFDVDHEDEDREHFQLHGMGDAACGSDCVRSPLPQNISVSISTASPHGNRVFHREGIDPQEWWTHVPSDSIKRWGDGAYEICLSWGEGNARCKQRRSIEVTSESRSDTALQVTPDTDVRALQAIDWAASAGGVEVTTKPPHCGERPLEYKLGSGVLVKGILEQSGMQQGSPILSDLLNAPNVNTGFIPVTSASTGSQELRSILSDAVCSSGVCSGTIPGCQKTVSQTLHIARIQFIVSRPVHWVPDAPFMLRDAVAFGLSLLPEAIHVLKIRAEHAGRVADLEFAAESLLGVNSKCYDINNPGCAGRRLKDITADHVFSSFTVGIQAPLQLDEKFLKMLVQHQALDQISDGFEEKLGDIQVIGFNIDHGSADSNGGSEAENLRPSDFFGGTGAWFVMVMAVVATTFSLHAVFKSRVESTKRAGVRYVEASKSADEEEAHEMTMSTQDQSYMPVDSMDP